MITKTIAKSYFRHFIPMFRRSCLLLFRRNNQIILKIAHSQPEPLNIQSFLFLEIELINVLFLKLDKNIYPIFHDNVKLTTSIPKTFQDKSFDIKAIGIFKSKSKKIKLKSNSQMIVNSLQFDRLGHIGNVKFNNELIEVSIKSNPIELNYKTSPSLIKNIELQKYGNQNITLDLNDLEEQLKYQLQNEQ